MSKKKYRIYKAGGAQQGRVMNPTAMWFAQMGAQQPSQEEMMMMQQGAQQPQQQGPSEEELMAIMQALQEVMESGENPQELIAQMLEGQVPPEIIIQALVQIGAPTKDAERLVMTTIEQMQAAQSQEQGQPQMSEEEMMAMQQQQAPQQAMYAGGISKKNYIKKKLKEAKVGMSMDEESEVGSATNFAANTQPVKNALLNFNEENIIRNNASNEFDNIQMAQNQTQADDSLEQARFGRGRARRQDRQLDRTVRKAFGDIAFPAGVAPMMMPGAPMMGGAPSVLDMEVHRGGLFNRIKEVKMHMENTGAGNMPVNFAQGMFMNGLYNPMSMQNSGDFMYNITYPGTRENSSSNVTGRDNDFITIPYPDNSGGGNNGGGGNNDGGKNNTEPTTNTKPEGGCGEGMKWDPNTLGENGLAGKCVEDKKVDPGSCSGGRVFDPLSGECKCKDAKTPLWDAASGKCVAQNVKVIPPEDGTNYLLPAALLAMGVGYVNREKIAKYLVDKGVKKGDKKAIQAAIQEISDKNLQGYFSNVADDAMEPLVGKNGQLLMGFFDDAQSVQGPQDMRKVGSNVAEEVIPPVNANRPSGNMFDYPEQAGPKQRPKLQAPDYSKSQQRLIKNKYNAALKSRDALEALAKEYKIPIGVPKAGGKQFSKKYLKTSIKKFFNFIKEDGGAVDSMDEMYGNPDLYRFTGGGQGMDYFDEGGYYEDGGSTNDFEMMGQPAYKNVYDPYMNNDMTGEVLFENGGGFQEGQELYMPIEKIAQFMAAGGVVEFLD